MIRPEKTSGGKEIEGVTRALCFNVRDLGKTLSEGLPDAVFAFLLGSSQNGIIGPNSDLDIAFFLKPGTDPFQFLQKVLALFDSSELQAVLDVGILNGAEPVFRFEALNGTLLFSRDENTQASFFSLTCREYEMQMSSYHRQRKYRLESLAKRS